MLSLTRKKLYLIGLVVMIFYSLLNRVHFIGQSKITMGVVKEFFPHKNIMSNAYGNGSPIVTYWVNDTACTMAGEEWERCSVGDMVKVIYKKDNPHDAAIFSFAGFWITPLWWCVLPFMLWSAFAYSFVSRHEVVIFDMRNFRFAKNNKQETGLKKWMGGK